MITRGCFEPKAPARGRSLAGASGQRRWHRARPRRRSIPAREPALRTTTAPARNPECPRFLIKNVAMDTLPRRRRSSLASLPRIPLISTPSVSPQGLLIRGKPETVMKRILVRVLLGASCLLLAACPDKQRKAPVRPSTERAVGDNLCTWAYRTLTNGGSLYEGKILSVTVKGRQPDLEASIEYGTLQLQVDRTIAGKPQEEVTVPFWWWDYRVDERAGTTADTIGAARGMHGRRRVGASGASLQQQGRRAVSWPGGSLLGCRPERPARGRL